MLQKIKCIFGFHHWITSYKQKRELRMTCSCCKVKYIAVYDPMYGMEWKKQNKERK